jgi:hypothetical protein
MENIRNIKTENGLWKELSFSIPRGYKIETGVSIGRRPQNMGRFAANALYENRVFSSFVVPAPGMGVRSGF